MLFKSNLKFSFIIYFSFILFTIIGTVTHELGHYLVGRYLGYQTILHYGSTSWGDSQLKKELKSIYENNKVAIDTKEDFLEKTKFEHLIKKNQNNHFWILFGGPFQTIFTGTIGFFLVIRLRSKKKFAQTKLDWLCLFIALFWLRQPTNLLSWLLKKPFNQINNTGDEIKLAYYLNLPEGCIIIISGMIGFAISAYVILKFVPKDNLITFCFGGFMGGVSGYILWLKIIGPIILP